MPPKKPMMNDMVVKTKPSVKKEVVSVPQKPVQVIVRPKEIALPRIIDDGKKRGGGILWIISLVCVIALVVGVGGLFTHASLEIVPKEFQGVVDTSLTLSQIKTATRTFTEETVIPATGVTDKAAYATGTVRFYNAGTAAKTLPKGTIIVSAAKKEYSLAKAITIPAMKAKTPGQIDVIITAREAGRESDSSPTDFVLQKPEKTQSVTIHSVTPLAGGALAKEATIDPASVEQAGDALKEKFEGVDVLAHRMAEEIPETMIMVPVIFPTNPPIISVEPNHPDGVHVIAKKTATIILVDRTSLGRALGDTLGAPDDLKLTLDTFDGLTVTTNSIAPNAPIPAVIQVRITGTTRVIGEIDTIGIIDKVKGLHRKAARETLLAIPEVGSFTLRMRPFWRRTLPLSTEDIEFYPLTQKRNLSHL